MLDYLLLFALVGVPISAFLVKLVLVLQLGYEIEATLWSLPI